MRYIGVGHFKSTPEMRRLVNTVLDTNRISYGPLCKLWEEKFSAIHGCRFGVLSNSGTSSLHVALQTLKELHGWHDGDEVIVPASTFVATVNIILHNRLKPVLVDVEDGLWGINVEQVERAITKRTRCIIPVHPFGMPCNHEVTYIAYRNCLKVIEDSCETMFVGYKNWKVGSWGDIGCFSMYVAHLITTGVGGTAITNNPDYAVKMRSLVNHGRDNIYISTDDDDNVSKDRLHEVIGRRFMFPSIGHSYRITELEAALGLPQLDDWQLMIATRQENARFLKDKLCAYGDRLQVMGVRPDTECSWMMFPIACKYPEKKRLCEYLEEHGIETRDALPLTNQPCYAGMFNEDDYPVAKKLNQRGLYLASHTGLSLTDLEYISEIFAAYFKEFPHANNCD